MKRTVKLEIFQSERNREWYFHVRAANSKIVLSSEGYKKRASAVKSAHNILADVSRGIWVEVKPSLAEKEMAAKKNVRVLAHARHAKAAIALQILSNEND